MRSSTVVPADTADYITVRTRLSPSQTASQPQQASRQRRVIPRARPSGTGLLLPRLCFPTEMQGDKPRDAHLFPRDGLLPTAHWLLTTDY